jgi:phosphoglycerate dehydrogenase-like enzyme
MKVVLAGLLTDEFVADLREGFPEVGFAVATTPDDQRREIRDADVFFGAPGRDVFVAAEKLRWLQSPGTGIERLVAIPELIDSDVVLTNARDTHTAPMADHVMSMVLDFAHRTNEMMADQAARRWDTPKYDQRIAQLGGSTMGILALGGVGMAVARRAHAFGLEVYAVDKKPFTTPAELEAVWGFDKLDDLLGMADWFVVTAPLTHESRGMIDAGRLALMKPTAHLIIISRGGIVEEQALLDTLRDGRIAGAGVDAFEHEPLSADSPFWDLDNIIISPHASALTTQMWEGRRQIFKENLRRFLANEPFLYVCDKQAGF